MKVDAERLDRWRKLLAGSSHIGGKKVLEDELFQAWLDATREEVEPVPRPTGRREVGDPTGQTVRAK